MTEQVDAAAEQPGVETFTTKADKNEGSREITISWDLGKDVNETVEKFGAEVIHGMAKKALIVAAQATVRRMLVAMKEDGSGPKFSDDEIRNWVFTQYKPGVRQAREGGGSSKAFEAALAKLAKMSPEDREKLFAELAAAKG